METLESHMRIYRDQHRTLGCKVTHMFGVPMIVASIPTAFFNLPTAAGLFAGGWVLQFLGHFAYEHNSPVFLNNPTDPYTYLSAVVFVSEEWGKAVTGKPLVESTSIEKQP